MIDTNTVVSAVLKPGSVPDHAVRLALTQDMVMVSPAILAEYAAVLARPKFAKILLPERRLDVLARLSAAATMIDAPAGITDCRDLRDNMYLDLALAGRADFIVTGDQDLLVLDPWRGVRVVTPAAYLAHLAGTLP